MLNCSDCAKEFVTSAGMQSHWKQVHDPHRKIVNRRGQNNPHFGCKGKNQFSTRVLSEIPWEKLGSGSRRQLLLEEAGYACTQCGYNKTRECGGLILEIDHKDGNHKNNSRENLRVLCPNCHALTPNFRNWGRSHKNGKTSTRTNRSPVRSGYIAPVRGLVDLGGLMSTEGGFDSCRTDWHDFLGRAC